MFTVKYSFLLNPNLHSENIIKHVFQLHTNVKISLFIICYKTIGTHQIYIENI